MCLISCVFLPLLCKSLFVCFFLSLFLSLVLCLVLSLVLSWVLSLVLTLLVSFFVSLFREQFEVVCRVPWRYSSVGINTSTLWRDKTVIENDAC